MTDKHSYLSGSMEGVRFMDSKLNCCSSSVRNNMRKLKFEDEKWQLEPIINKDLQMSTLNTTQCSQRCRLLKKKMVEVEEDEGEQD